MAQYAILEKTATADGTLLKLIIKPDLPKDFIVFDSQLVTNENGEEVKEAFVKDFVEEQTYLCPLGQDCDVFAASVAKHHEAQLLARKSELVPPTPTIEPAKKVEVTFKKA